MGIPQTEYEQQREIIDSQHRLITLQSARLELLERQLEALTGHITCGQCRGRGEYWTEWSNAAENDTYHKSRVVEYPDEPDGTVLYRCACQIKEEA